MTLFLFQCKHKNVEADDKTLHILSHYTGQSAMQMWLNLHSWVDKHVDWIQTVS